MSDIDKPTPAPTHWWEITPLRLGVSLFCLALVLLFVPGIGDLGAGILMISIGYLIGVVSDGR